MRELLYLTPSEEAFDDLSMPSEPLTASNPTVQVQNQAFPVLVGASVAFGALLIFATFTYLIRLSIRRSAQRTLPFVVAVEPREEGQPPLAVGAEESNVINRPSLDPSKVVPTRVPVVIVEPDATVEIAYALKQNSEVGESSASMTAPLPARPLLRTPSLPAGWLRRSGSFLRSTISRSNSLEPAESAERETQFSEAS